MIYYSNLYHIIYYFIFNKIYYCKVVLPVFPSKIAPMPVQYYTQYTVLFSCEFRAVACPTVLGIVSLLRWQVWHDRTYSAALMPRQAQKARGPTGDPVLACLSVPKRALAALAKRLRALPAIGVMPRPATQLLWRRRPQRAGNIPPFGVGDKALCQSTGLPRRGVAGAESGSGLQKAGLAEQPPSRGYFMLSSIMQSSTNQHH